MGFADGIAIAAIVLIVGAAVFYIIRAKRRGQKCIGCPYAKGCSGKCGGACGHAKDDEHNEKS